MAGLVNLPFRRPRPRDDRDSDAQRTGCEGERLAEEYLVRVAGFRVLARNWRDGREEIDLVASHDGVLVFVEVKTRRSEGLVPGYYAAVDGRKKDALRRAIRTYLRRLRDKPRSFRFDVVEVNLEGPPDRRILHFENIPLFAKSFRAR